MAKKKSLRTIKVSNEAKKKLAKVFNCTERMVYKALCFESDTPLAQKIQHVAIHDMNGWVEVAYPECETIHDEGKGEMVQTFGNGAVLRLVKNSGDAIVDYHGETRLHMENISVSQICFLQEYAAGI